jgi:hypothetical protein
MRWGPVTLGKAWIPAFSAFVILLFWGLADAQEKGRGIPPPESPTEKAIEHKVPLPVRVAPRFLGCAATDDPRPNITPLVQVYPQDLPDGSRLCNVRLAVANLGDAGVPEANLVFEETEETPRPDASVHMRMHYQFVLTDGTDSDEDHVWIYQYPDELNLTESCSRTGWYQDLTRLRLVRGQCGDLLYEVDINHLILEGPGERGNNETSVTVCCE